MKFLSVVALEVLACFLVVKSIFWTHVNPYTDRVDLSTDFVTMTNRSVFAAIVFAGFVAGMLFRSWKKNQIIFVGLAHVIAWFVIVLWMKQGALQAMTTAFVGAALPVSGLILGKWIRTRIEARKTL